MSHKRKPGQKHKGWKGAARKTLSSGQKSALLRLEKMQKAPITLPHAETLAAMTRRMEALDVR